MSVLANVCAYSDYLFQSVYTCLLLVEFHQNLLSGTSNFTALQSIIIAIKKVKVLFRIF